ncbi:GTP cyclohydrolase II RibA [Paenarthrobacter sp. GOM3]|uniref:GTP cyclohydrolase II RibA n=1 Tax=Paenarthrobacter sp. GOM3 TaxID=2782567 RepID=UPI001BACD866|nr:GTP cyclohydrolase II RibA [Paenarthrobacter sp. GOM3]WOH20663.1 GTP cyclohydrolase II RibA [Paenarthrobacter sp. GOM3]
MTASLDIAPPAASLPRATVRSNVTVPLQFPDGFRTTAEVFTFHGLADGKEHLLLALGSWEQSLLAPDGEPGVAPLVRLHSECMTGDVFGSERCDCGPQLREAVEEIAAVGGFLLYLRQEGRGIGLYSKLDAYALQDNGLDTYEANLALGHGEDERDYSAGVQMLQAIGATRIRLLSNNPDKATQLSALGMDITVPALRGSGFDTEPPSPATLISLVGALLPRLRERASETEELRRLPESTMTDLRQAGVFRLLAPRGVGGYGMGVETYAEVVRQLARGCASIAWTAGHLMEHVWMLARWPKEVQDEVFALGRVPLAAATGAPVGVATKVPGGYSISGHWSFASGVMHSEWALLAVDCDGVRLQALVPVAALELMDAWHTAGLRGTGSNDLRADHLFVPDYRVMEWGHLSASDNPGSLLHPDPTLHILMATLLNLVAPSTALGAAEHALELFQAQLMVRKVKNTTEVRQADSVLAQARFSEAFGLVATARLHWEEAVRILAASIRRSGTERSGTATAGTEPTDTERSRYRLSLALSGQAAEAAVRLIVAGSGGSAHRLSHPLQRIQRDVNVLLNHPTLSFDPIVEQAGRGLLGLGFTVRSF